MSKNENKTYRSKRVEVITETGEVKKVSKPNKVFILRLTENSHKAILKQNQLTGLSRNSIISLCIDLQLNNLPDYKIDNIVVSYTNDDGEQKSVKYSGNSLKNTSLHNRGEEK